MLGWLDCGRVDTLLHSRQMGLLLLGIFQIVGMYYQCNAC